jgi:hypothetical protein
VGSLRRNFLAEWWTRVARAVVASYGNVE